jgi:MFS family permease
MEAGRPGWHPITYWPRLLASWAGLSTPVRSLMVIGVGYGLSGGLLLPYTAVYLAQRFGLGAAPVGLLFAVLGVASMPLQLASGHFSDRWGRRRLLLSGLVCSALAFIPIASGAPLLVTMAAFAAVWFGMAMVGPVESAAVVDFTEPSERDRAFAWIYAAGNAGFAVGPLLGGILVSVSYLALFSAVALVLALMAGLVAIALPEGAPIVEGAKGQEPSAHVWQDRGVLVLLLLLAASRLLDGQIDVGLPLWVVRQLRHSAVFYGSMMSLNGTLITLAQVGVSSVARRRPRTTVIATGTLMFGLGLGMMALARVPALFAGVAVFTIGEMLLATTVPTMLASLSATDRRGQYQGAGVVAQSFGMAMGPLVGGLIYQGWGGRALWSACAAWGMLGAVAYVLYGRWRSLDAPELP